MNKPDSLRRLLLRAIPQLRDNPEALLLFVDQGRVGARAGAGLSFECRYALNIVLTAFSGDQNAIFVPLLAWILEQQPDLMNRPDSEPFTFESEILDGDTSDISITLQLSELVRVTATDAGYQVEDVPESGNPDRFPGVCAHLLKLYANDDLVAQSEHAEP